MGRLSHCRPLLFSLEFEILHRAEIELALDKEESSQSTLVVESGNCGHYGRHLSLQLIGSLSSALLMSDHSCHSNLVGIFRMCVIIDKLLCVLSNLSSWDLASL